MTERKNVFITGGLGGLGQSMVQKFLESGANVFYTSSSQEKINNSNFKKYFDDQIIHGEVCDMADFVNISEVSKKILSYGPIDTLICNAGTNCDKLSIRMDMSEWMKVININLNANFKLISEFIKSMSSLKKGKIIVISSVVASTGNIGQANYAASKAGLEGMVRSLALEYARYNITVNAIAPGFIETPMTDKLSDQIRENLLKKIPMGRYGKPDDISSMAFYLASELGNYITGQIIHINGGMYFS